MDFGITIEPDIFVGQPFLAVLLRCSSRSFGGDHSRTDS